MNTTSAQLEQRLRTGEQMIDAATSAEERARLEAFWLDLLRQYEAAIDAERAQDDRRQSA